MKRATVTLTVLLTAATAAYAVDRNPTGVNVNAQGATSVFITFGDLRDQVPVEAIWCGDLIPAAPDIGFKCAPGTIFGQLPIRFDQSRLTQNGTVFTDIMSIPPSAARRAYQAAAAGENSAFFYVRRFQSTIGGPDEYVTVTCRLSGGGARVPLALLDVRLAFEADDTVLSVERGQTPPRWDARISYNGTGRLRGRWEIVIPGDPPPSDEDLLTEATLPPEQRGLQRRYTLVDRFDVFLPPTGRITLEGPDPTRLPTTVDGLYEILLRIEATDDKEGNSNRGAAGAPGGVVVSGGVAGFPMPTLRYFVGSVEDSRIAALASGLALLSPRRGSRLDPSEPLDFRWNLARSALLYRLEIEAGGEVVLRAIVQQGLGSYRAPRWLQEQLGGGPFRWRVVSIGPDGIDVAATEWEEIGAATP